LQATQNSLKIFYLSHTGCFAGSPSYYSSSDIVSSSSSGILCDIIKNIISTLTEAAIQALKDYIRRRLGRSAEDNSEILILACQELGSNPDLSDSDREVFETILNLEKIDPKSEFGFDLDAAWECIKDMFSDLYDSSSSEPTSSEPSSTEILSSSETA
jgi:hypothetical protein